MDEKSFSHTYAPQILTAILASLIKCLTSFLSSIYFQESHWEVHRLDCGRTQRYLLNTAKYLRETTNLPDKSCLAIISAYDASETLQLERKWPRTFSCELEECPKCGERLLPLAKRHQKNRNDKQILVTKLHVIDIDILSKRCKPCSLHLSPDTLQHGLLNVGDVTLLSLDIFFTIRNTIR